MKLINDSLNDLRHCAPKETEAVFRDLSPAPQCNPADEGTDEMTGVANHLSAVDVRHPATDEKDMRRGGVEDQFKRILRDRQPHQLTLMSPEEMNKRIPDNPFRDSKGHAG